MSKMTVSEDEKQVSSIVCFAGCDWWYHNRGLFCPQVMTRLAKDYKVLFVNSIGMRIPSLKKDRNAVKKIIRKLRSISHFVRKVNNGMYVLSPLPLPFFGNYVGRKLNAFCVFFQVKLAMTLLRFRRPIFYIGCPPALEVVKKLGQKYLIYERTDFFEEMPEANKSYIASLDNEMAESADLVLYVNKALWEQGVKKNKNSLLVGHGVDFPFFANAEESDYVPEDIVKIPKPIVGYFGDICNKTFDFDLLQHLATSLPFISFVLIGPLSSDISCLKKFKNIHILGQKRYEDIPHYGKVFDASILPWKRNRWVIYSYPIKIKEYLALGNPFVSVDIPAVEPFKDTTYVARDYDDFVFQVRRAVEDKDTQARRKRREAVRSETWDKKVEQIRAAIEKGLAGSNPA